MMAPILSALGVSALLLLAFGDMLGLPAPLVRLLAIAILGLVASGVVLARATARFGQFLRGDEGRHAPGAGLVAAGLAGGVLLVLARAPNLPISLAAIAFFSGFMLALLIFVPPKPDAEPGFRDIAIFRAIGVSLLAVLILLTGFPTLSVALNQMMPLSSPQSLGLVLIGVPVIFGGMASLAALANLVLLLALVFVLGPLLVYLGLSARGGGIINVYSIIPALPALPKGNAHLQLLEPVALGFALALATRLGRGKNAQTRRYSRPILGIVLGLGLVVCAAAIILGMTHIFTSELAARPVSSWPLWAFDEAIRGWISLCGQPIASYAETTRSCAQQGIAFSGQLTPDPAMMLPGLALAKGWPVLFGIIPNLIILLALALAGAMLLHAGVAALSSLWALLRMRQMALRSQRLALMRCLALLILIAIGGSALAPIPDQVRIVLLISAILLIGIVEIAAGLRRFQRWRQQRSPARPLALMPDMFMPDAA